MIWEFMVSNIWSINEQIPNNAQICLHAKNIWVIKAKNIFVQQTKMAAFCATFVICSFIDMIINLIKLENGKGV